MMVEKEYFMHKKIFLVALTACALLNSSFCFAQEPRNIFLVKSKLVQYHDSGEYLKDQARVIDQAMEYLKTRITANSKSHHPKKLAIVLDIDETSLSNYPDMRALDFGGTFQEIVDAEGKGTDPVIQPTLNLYRYAKENSVSVFFVTGRTENYRAGTEKNLLDMGYKNWDGLILKSENYHEKSAANYKILAREDIEKHGYDIVLNIGDQRSDLVGGHADKTFRLPNPYYIVP
jgi:predicted secreted acid phosphatase